MSLKLTSESFRDGDFIPDRHSKLGGDISPALAWSGVPEGTRSLALIVDDPDAPSKVFVHWLLYGIKPGATALPAAVLPTAELPGGQRQGVNDFGDSGYGGPHPPSGTHRYFFHLYALDIDSDLPAGLNRKELDRSIEGHVIEEAQLMGRYQYHER